jgi:tRNA pseudouridine55 synthase
MRGVLVVDKPRGLTSHDVVAVARRALGESRIGHTGTLDPLATGVLPLAVGQATRLVRFLTSSDKDYDAIIRFGFTTDSFDITGTETSRSDEIPSADAMVTALATLTGDYLQEPPAFSAKKVAGQRAYDLARQSAPVTLRPVPVRVTRAVVTDFSDGRAHVSLTCSAGFYVRAFAHSLGQLTGTGACLEALRRTRSGEFEIDAALSVPALQDQGSVAGRIVPLEALLPRFPAVSLTERGRAYATHGRELGSDDYAPALHEFEWARLFDATGALVALGSPGRSPGALHPSVVLI